MSNRATLARLMPAMLLHEGTWQGRYQTVDLDGRIIDAHDAHVVCEFPDSGEIVYNQKNRFVWDDGREVRLEFGGVLDGDRLFWDTDRFRGYGWATHDNVVMLNLDRKDEPGASFLEVIILGADGKHRVRTWHWFKDGRPTRRTLCNETLIRSPQQ